MRLKIPERYVYMVQAPAWAMLICIVAYMLECSGVIEYLYTVFVSLAASCGTEVFVGWGGGGGGDASGERLRGKRESLRRVRALMAPLTTSSVMVSLALWLLWNCRPALYSWGLRGDKRPFNSERREVTEKEALREGYQSGIHHTNLSLGTGPARERPWRWSWACMCVSSCVPGDAACVEWQLQREGEELVCSGVWPVTVHSGGE